MSRRRLLISLVLLNGLLLVPALALPGNNPVLAVEALVVWAALCGLTQHRQRLSSVLATVYALLILLVLADALIRQSLGRGLNLYLEIGVLDATWNLLTTNLGPALAVAGLLFLGAALVALGWLFRCLFGQVGLHAPRQMSKPLWLMAGLAVAGSITPWIGSPAWALVVHQASLVHQTHNTQQAFASELGTGSGELRQASPLAQLAGRDVIFGFVESYGISALADDRYRPLTQPALDTLERELKTAGLTVASGRLQSPIQGGQSWLGHTSVLSGLWIANQLAYETLLSSGYSTLIDDFRSTGHRTLAIMPAITQPWPEGSLLGYSQIYDHDDLGYLGPAFNWVTMPDQYTWYRFQQLRQGSDRPVFAELALISSHAPWVPILPVLDDWEAIGRGEIFQRWQGVGEAPVSLWRDPDRVRLHYGQAIAYALATAGGFAGRYLGDNALLILLGDHQPAPLITGEGASRDVVVHVISADPDLVAPFLSGQLPGFRLGVWPDLRTAGAPMSRFRAFLHKQFGDS